MRLNTSKKQLFKVVLWFPVILLSSILVMPLGSGNAQQNNTLKLVKERGLKCGIRTLSELYSGSEIKGLPGFAAEMPDPDNPGEVTLQGMDIEFCRALSAAIFGENYLSKIKYVEVGGGAHRYKDLIAGEIDVLLRNTTHTLIREASLGLTWTNYYYIDTNQLLYDTTCISDDDSLYQTLSSEKITLPGSDICRTGKKLVICLPSDTTSEANFRSEFPNIHPSYFHPSIDNNISNIVKNGECDIVSGDRSTLAIFKDYLELKYFNISTDKRLELGKEPLGPVVRQGDEEWEKIVRWVLFAMINADELSLNQDIIKSEDYNADNPNVRLFLGIGEVKNIGFLLGLKPDWALNIIKHVGSYSDVYNRTIGNELFIDPLISLGGERVKISDINIYAPPIGLDENYVFYKYKLKGGLNVRVGASKAFDEMNFDFSSGEVVEVLLSNGEWKLLRSTDNPERMGWANTHPEYMEVLK